MSPGAARALRLLAAGWTFGSLQGIVFHVLGASTLSFWNSVPQTIFGLIVIAFTFEWKRAAA